MFSQWPLICGRGNQLTQRVKGNGLGDVNGSLGDLAPDPPLYSSPVAAHINAAGYEIP